VGLAGGPDFGLDVVSYGPINASVVKNQGSKGNAAGASH